MASGHDPADTIGLVIHSFSRLSVAAVRVTAPLAVGDRIHIRGHTTDLVQDLASLEVDLAHVDRAMPGDDVALKVEDHVRDHDMIFREA